MTETHIRVVDPFHATRRVPMEGVHQREDAGAQKLSCTVGAGRWWTVSIHQR
jgi:hypothetical protein